MTVRFRYSHLPGYPISPLKPLIPVILHNNQIDFPIIALVDSGADRAAISTEVASKLGINWQKIPPQIGSTISASFTYHPTKLKISIYEYEFLLAINVVEGESIIDCILGQEDLFKHARIVFERYREVFEISFKEFD